MKTNSGDRHILISPSRTYVLFVADKINPDDSANDHVYKITLPDEHDNDETEVASYFFENFDAHAEITNCLTYEMYAEQKLARDFEDPSKNRRDPRRGLYFNYDRDRVVGSSSKKEKAPDDIPAISSKRIYVVAVHDSDMPKGCRLEKFELPEGYENNSDEALAYYGIVVEPESHILECSSYELFAMTIADLFDKEFGILGKKAKHKYKPYIKYRDPHIK